MKTRYKNSKRGFTLIELLVAMAITTIIVTVLVSVTALALDTWNRSRAEIRAARQAKSMIDSMARDFESFVSRRGNDFEWLYAKSEPPSEGPKDSRSPNALDLIFFSAATDRYDGKIGDANFDKGGDVSTVGYKLTYKDPIGSEDKDEYKTFVLYRKILNPDETFEKLLGKANIKPEFDAVTASSGAIDMEENFICENVYQFTVTFHVSATVPDTSKPGNPPPSILKSVAVPIGNKDSDGLTKELRITGSGINTTFVPPTSTGVTNDQLKAGRLTAAEISITVLSDFGLQQMRRRGDLTGDKLAEFIAKNSYQYSKVVQMPGS